LPAEESEEKTIATALADPRIAELTAGKQIIKTVVVPKRLVNVVIKG
jgi:leucyl-tRNA synthetase